MQYILGHRDQFKKIFYNLKRFYSSVMSQHYFMSLLTIKQLPDNPPNFPDFVTNEAYEIAQEQLQEEVLIATMQNEVNPTAPPATPLPVRARNQNESMTPLMSMIADTSSNQQKVLDQEEWINHLKSEVERQS